MILGTGLFFLSFLPPRSSADDLNIDPTFNGGKAVTDFALDAGKLVDDIATDAAFQPNGKLVVAGYTQQYAGGIFDDRTSDFALARYDSDGRLDPSFGKSGRVIADLFGNRDRANALQILPDGRIIAGGTCLHPDGRGGFASDFALVCFQADGTLDTGFGQNGIVTTDFTPAGESSDAFESISRLFLLSDAKILALGVSSYGQGTYLLARYNPDGSLDRSFGNDGKRFASVGLTANSLVSAMVQSDGKIVLTAPLYTGLFTVYRLTADGVFDPAFGSSGTASIDLGTPSCYPKGVALQPDGKIVVAGQWSINPGSAVGDIAVARLNPDGHLDASFGEGGKRRVGFPGYLALANSVQVLSDGKIAIGGALQRFNLFSDFLVLRLDPGGSLDPSFGLGGKMTTDFMSGNDEAQKVLALPDGRMVAVGSAAVPGRATDFAIARYGANGFFDEFGYGGRTTVDYSHSDESASAVAIQPDAKILVAGTTDFIDHRERQDDFSLLRFNPDGSLDLTFGNSGRVATDFGNTHDVATAIALQGDGKILVAGLSDGSFVVARYDANGNLDNAFGSGGWTRGIFPDASIATCIALQSDGKILLGGRMNEKNAVGGYFRSDFALARLNSDGSIDTGFGHNGRTSTDFLADEDVIGGIVVQPDGKIVAAGYATVVRVIDGSTSADFAVARYNADGSLDRGFGDSGKLRTDIHGSDDRAYSIALLSDGRIVVAGYSYDPHANRGSDMTVVRYTAGGSIDGSFGVEGVAEIDFNHSSESVSRIRVQPDGKLVLGGYTTGYGSTDFALARLHADGTIDGQFGSGGKAWIDFTYGSDAAADIALQPDGKIILVGATDPPDTYGTDYGIARYDNSRAEHVCPAPVLSSATLEGKRLTVRGNFDAGSVILVNGVDVATVPDALMPSNVLIAKKGGKKIKPGTVGTIQVRNSCGNLTTGFQLRRDP